MKRNGGIAGRSIAPLMVIITLAGLSGCPTGPGTGDTRSYMLSAGVNQAVDNSALTAMVFCFEENASFPLSDASATVTVNGESVPPSFFGYMSSSLASAPEGSDVTLHFACDSVDITRALKMPKKPTGGSVGGPPPVHTTNPIDISWDSILPPPHQVVVSVSGLYTASGDTYAATLPGTATSHRIPVGTLLGGCSAKVVVSSTNDYASLGAEQGLSLFSYQVGNDAEVVFGTTTP